MSRLSRSSSSSLEDGSGAEEEKPSSVDLCHMDDVDTEASDMSKSPVAMVASVPSYFGSRCYRCQICGEVKQNRCSVGSRFVSMYILGSSYKVLYRYV